jgi:aldehyde dehydrogenase (NAD(P)+)
VTHAVAPPADAASLDHALEDLAAGKDDWARLAVNAKCAYLEQMRHLALTEMDWWIRLTLDAKRIAPGSPWAGPEWGIGPWYFLLGVVAMSGTLQAIARGEVPRVQDVRRQRDGRTAARVFPGSPLERALFLPITAEVWMQRGVTPSLLPETMASFYRQSHPRGRVALVLGAGNAVVLGLLDLIHKLFVEGQVVVLKMNPVVDYLEPVVADILAPLVDDGFVRIVSGDAQVGAYLVDHPVVEEVHLTGGLATHDAIVFGTGVDGARRRAQNDPRTVKRVTSELGGVSPVIVVPGPWTAADIRAQAEKIVAMKVNNCGHNCMAAQVLVLPAGWAPGQRLLEEIERHMRLLSPRIAFYPGAAQRQHELVQRHPQAIQIPSLNVPWTLIWGLDPAVEDEPAFTSEVFGPVLVQTSLAAPTLRAYLAHAVAFTNRRLLGTLAATLLIHPVTEHELGDELNTVLEGLEYGTVGVNEWPGMASFLPQCPWGSALGRPLNDVQSGRGFVHNALMFSRPEKTIIRSSFHPAPRAWRHGQPQLLLHPLYSANHPFGPIAGRRLTRLGGDPRWPHVPGVLTALVRGA